MRIDGIQLREGSNISNLTVASGTSFPANPNAGEMFYRSDASADLSGLYTYRNGDWHRINTAETVTIPSGPALPSTTLPGMFYYLNSGTSTEGLYYFDAEGGWIFFASTPVVQSQALSDAIAMAIALG